MCDFSTFVSFVSRLRFREKSLKYFPDDLGLQTSKIDPRVGGLKDFWGLVRVKKIKLKF